MSVWPDGDKVLGYLKEVDYVGLTGEIRLDDQGFRTEFHLDLIEKVRGRMKKTANWDTDIGLNYTLSASETNNMLVEQLANKTMRVVTTTVSVTDHREPSFFPPPRTTPT